MKHIIYKYGGDRSDDVDFDRRGILKFTKGDIISRHGVSWRIEAVEEELSLDDLMHIPTYWVYLARVPVN